MGAVQVVSTISPRAVNELRTQVDYRGQANDRFSGSGTGPSITILGVANFGGPTGVGMVYNETTPEIADTFSYDFSTHALKVGFSTPMDSRHSGPGHRRPLCVSDDCQLPGGGQRDQSLRVRSLRTNLGEPLAELQLAVQWILHPG